MKLFKGNYSAALTQQLIVPSVAKSSIKVHRLLITSWVGLHLILLSDPGGGEETEMSSQIRCTAGMNGSFDFRRPFELMTATEKALGVTTVYQGAPSAYSIMLWYEITRGW